jgi:hypothetical protein
MKMFQSLLCRAVVIVAGLGTLTACESGYRGNTSGASIPTSGAVVSGQDSCVQSCNNTNIRCMDASSTRRPASEDVTTIYGARSDCDAELRQCLPKCRGR